MLPIDIENVDYREGEIYIYIWRERERERERETDRQREFLTSYIRDPSHCLAKFTGCRMGDNRRTVNTSTSPHISDQLGTENVRETVMLIYRGAMSSGLQKYASIRTSFWIFPPVLSTSPLLMFPIAQSNLPKLAVGAAQRHHSWNVYLTSMFVHYIGGYIIN